MAFNQISPVLAKGLMLLGIKGDKLPSQPEVDYMIKMLQEDYGNLPIGELDLAFELMVKGKLDENPETYQNFSVLYLTRMLGSYARFVIANYIEPRETIEPARQIAPEKIDLDFIYEIFKKEPVPFWDIFMGLTAFDIIYTQNLFNFNFIDTLEKTIEAVKHSGWDKRKIKQVLRNEQEMENLCRKLVVYEYFLTLNK